MKPSQVGSGLAYIGGSCRDFFVVESEILVFLLGLEIVTLGREI